MTKYEKQEYLFITGLLLIGIFIGFMIGKG